MLKVALAQYAPETSRERSYEKIESLLHDSSLVFDLLILPELFSTPYFCQEQSLENFHYAQDFYGSDIAFLKKIARSYQAFVSTTIFEEKAPGLYANTAVTISPTEEIVALYRKAHIPQDPHFEEKFYFQPGNCLPPLVSQKKISFATAICWDQWFPELSRCLTLSGAHLVNYPTAIAWLEGEEKDFVDQLSAWQVVTRSQAITNGIYLSCVNRVGVEQKLHFWGHSHLTGPDGKTIIEFSAEQEGVQCAQLDKAFLSKIRTTWPFLRDRRPELYTPLTAETF